MQNTIYILTRNHIRVLSNCRIPLQGFSKRAPPVNSTLGKLFPRSGQQRWLSEHLNAEIWWKTLWLRSHPHVWVSSAMGFCCSTGPMPSPACVSTELGHGQDGHRGCARNSQILLELCITLRKFYLHVHALQNKYVYSERIYMPKHATSSWKEVMWFCRGSQLRSSVEREIFHPAAKKGMCVAQAKWRLKTKHQLNSDWHTSQRNQFHMRRFSLKIDQLS